MGFSLFIQSDHQRFESKQSGWMSKGNSVREYIYACVSEREREQERERERGE